MRILAIETSCDETALALIEASGGLPARAGGRAPKFAVLEDAVSSQIAVHAPFGGVVPNLAKREHLKNLPIVFKQMAHGKLPKIDALAVTVGPGLEPALWTGINFAKDLYKELKKTNPGLKLIGANHLEGHLYSFLLADQEKTVHSKSKILNPKQIQISKIKNIKRLFPAIALIVSGGHTILLRMDSLVKWKKLGETRDDAVGESFDKVAKMLGLPYPGGPEIQKLASKGDPRAIAFPRPMLHDKNYDFSYSGLKTSVLYYLRDHKLAAKVTSAIRVNPRSHPRESVSAADVAASFQEAALDVLVKKAECAAREFGAKSVLLSGGVAANKELRAKLAAVCAERDIPFLAPPMGFNTDNAVMIAVAGYMSILREKNRRFIAQGGMGI